MLEIFKYPRRADWADLCRRPVSHLDVEDRVRNILAEVEHGGDMALSEMTRRFDGVSLDTVRWPVSNGSGHVDQDLAKSIAMARENIETFHRAQLREETPVETQPGVRCWRRSVPVSKVGLYIPGGTAPLFSTMLMLGVPARIAGCPEVVVCTPPQRDGSLHPVIAYTATLLGLEQVYLVGGAQAIGAMAYGTETVPQVDKIFGPGNPYVTTAKQLVQKEGVAIDMPAGPSEVLVIADETCNPAFVAADLLSQAEHGADSQVVLVTDSGTFIDEVLNALGEQLFTLPREGIARQALQQSRAILVRDLEEGLAFSNSYAPEHLIIHPELPELAEMVINAGSVFLGPYSCESAGDYCSGTNHTLPTNGFARSYSGVSIESFMKKVTFQTISPTGLRNIGPAIECMASAEQLEAHRRAVTLRLNTLDNV